jgi:cytochrome c oxidase cbb3-type subunit 3
MNPRAAALIVNIAAGFALLGLGCERPPAADKAKEWTPADHDRAEEQASGGGNAPQQAPQAPPQRDRDASAAQSAAQLVEITWQENCLVCHGPLGRGDGPNGPMVKASDLTREEWQSKVSDADIAAIITNGKSRMPKFDLPPKVVEGLVARIRATRGR